MPTRILIPPQQEPVTLAEATTWCRIDDDITDQDAMLMMLIIAMREYAENLTGRAFISRTMELMLDCFPSTGVIHLPFPPLISVQYVAYLDTDGELQTLSGSPSEFQVDTHREPGRIYPVYQESWPSIRGEFNSLRIGFTAGYASASLVPKSLKLWMHARLATLYENREQIINGAMIEIPRAFADGLLDSLITADRLTG